MDFAMDIYLHHKPYNMALHPIYTLHCLHFSSPANLIMGEFTTENITGQGTSFAETSLSLRNMINLKIAHQIT